MRVLVLMVLLVVPDLAWAACSCACVDGEAKSVCEHDTDVPIICMRLCPQFIGRPPGADLQTPAGNAGRGRSGVPDAATLNSLR